MSTRELVCRWPRFLTSQSMLSRPEELTHPRCLLTPNRLLAAATLLCFAGWGSRCPPTPHHWSMVSSTLKSPGSVMAA